MNGDTNNLSRSWSSPRYRWTHDVFLNFRGPETRNNFVSHLYTALTGRKLKVFKDDKTIRMGRHIPLSLSKAIEESRISIVVFSPNYGESDNCLDELVMIMNCSRSMGRFVYPVFYHVEPSEVGHQSGCFQEGFAVHKNPMKRAVWTEALREATLISGIEVNGTGRNESECITIIVETVLRELVPRRLALGSLRKRSAYWCLLSFLNLNGEAGAQVSVGTTGLASSSPRNEPNEAHAEVYKQLYESVHIGKLSRRVVAIKKIHVSAMMESDSKFLNEVSIRSSMKHENVAKLFGYCIKDTRRFLVEEHATEGTLHQILHGAGSSQRQGRFVIALTQRVTIAFDVSKGLEYLHAQNRLGHIDSSNVLLLRNLQAKISTGSSASQSYRAPEEGELTKKGDVYSFGVLLLELLTGRKPSEGIVESVLPTLTINNVETCIDPKLNGNYTLRDARKLAWAALLATKDQPSNRPDMKVIVQYLNEVTKSKKPIHRNNHLSASN